MMKYLSKGEYEASVAATHDKRMQWWREARFGMFVHYGLYSVRGRMEWAMPLENSTVEEYEKYAQNTEKLESMYAEYMELENE